MESNRADTMEKRKAAFLDRDGVINVDKDYLYRIEDFEYEEGALTGLKTLEEAGYLLIVITNQSGIARGYYTEEDYRKLEKWIFKDLEQRGIHISGSYFCPHHPNAAVLKYKRSCDCRKPATGLFYRAAEELSVDLDRSIAIGDKERDLQICKETKARGFLLRKRGAISIDISGNDDFTITDWAGICQALKRK